MKRISVLLTLFVILTQFSCEKNKEEKNLVFQPGPEDGNDALIWNLSPSIPRGNSVEFSACTWTNLGRLTILRSLIKFDLSSLHTPISEAKLYLYGYMSTSNGPSESLTQPNFSLLSRVTSAWDEQTVTWNNQPSFDLSDAIMLDSCNTITDYEIDVTAHVNQFIQEPSQNYGWILTMVDEVNWYQRIIFASSDNENPALRPKLVLKY